MGADFICIVVPVDKPVTYWLERVAAMDDKAIIDFTVATELEFSWNDNFPNERELVSHARAELVAGISIAYDPGRDGMWTQINGSPYCVIGEHSWGDVSELYESVRVFRDFQTHLEFKEQFKEDN